MSFNPPIPSAGQAPPEWPFTYRQWLLGQMLPAMTTAHQVLPTRIAAHQGRAIEAEIIAYALEIVDLAIEMEGQSHAG